MVNVTGSKIWVPTEKALPQVIHMCNMKALYLILKKIQPRLKFFTKVGQMLGSNSHGQTFWFQQNGPDTRNTHELFYLNYK